MVTLTISRSTQGQRGWLGYSWYGNTFLWLSRRYSR